MKKSILLPWFMLTRNYSEAAEKQSTVKAKYHTARAGVWPLDIMNANLPVKAFCSLPSGNLCSNMPEEILLLNKVSLRGANLVCFQPWKYLLLSFIKHSSGPETDYWWVKIAASNKKSSIKSRWLHAYCTVLAYCNFWWSFHCIQRCLFFCCYFLVQHREKQEYENPLTWVQGYATSYRQLIDV